MIFNILLVSTHQGTFVAHSRVGDQFVPLCQPFNNFSSELTPLVTYHLITVTMCLGDKCPLHRIKVMYTCNIGVSSPWIETEGLPPPGK